MVGLALLLVGLGCSGSSGDRDAGPTDAPSPEVGAPDAGLPDVAQPDTLQPDSWAVDAPGPDTVPAADMAFFWGADVSAPEAGSCTGGLARSFGKKGVYDWVAATLDSAGNAVVAMHFDTSGDTIGGLTLTNKGKEDFFLAKMDRCGNYHWALTVGGKGRERITNLAADPLGNIYAFGIFEDTVAFGKHAVTAMKTGSAFLAKLSPAGQFLWVTTFGPYESKAVSRTCDTMIWDLAFDASGNVFMAGRVSGSTTLGSYTLTSKGHEDLLVAKLSPKGKVMWATSAGTDWSETATSIVVDSKGNSYITGYWNGCWYKWCLGANPLKLGSTTLTYSGCADVLVAKLDDAGKFQWGATAGTNWKDYGDSIQLLDSGDLVISGSHGSFYMFPPTSLPKFGGVKVKGTHKKGGFLAGLTGQGKFTWASVDSGSGSMLAPGPGKSLLMAGDLVTTLGSADAARIDATGKALKVFAPSGGYQHVGHQISYNAKTGALLHGAYQGAVGFGKHILTSKGTSYNDLDAYLWWLPPSQL